MLTLLCYGYKINKLYLLCLVTLCNTNNKGVNMQNSYISIIIFAVIMTITPGPNNILLTVSGTKFGFKKSLGFVLGIVLGLNSQIILFSMGLGILFSNFPHLQEILKVPGIIYILYLAFKIGFSDGSKGHASALEKPLTVQNGFIFQYLNPKAYLMTLTTTSLYSASGDKFIFSIMIIVVIFSIIAPVCTSLWALFGAFIGKLTMGKSSNIVNKSLGVITAISVLFII